MKKIVKIVAFRGNSGNSGGDGGGDEVLNYNCRGTGRGKTAGDLGERVPRGPRGIPICDSLSFYLCVLCYISHGGSYDHYRHFSHSTNLLSHYKIY